MSDARWQGDGPVGRVTDAQMDARRDGHGRSRPDSWPGLVVARRIAAEHGSTSLGTQHLLLALFDRPEGPAQQVLGEAGLDRDEVVASIRNVHGSGPWPPPRDPHAVTMSDRVEVVLGRAAEARSSTPGDGQVRDEDILSALLDDRDPATARLVLGYFGITTRIAGHLRARLQTWPGQTDDN